MAIFTLSFAAQLAISTGLAVMQAPPGIAAAPGAAAGASPAFRDARGDRGHLYYADRCEDCFYKGAQCGCEPAVEYFACLTKHCHPSNHSLFAGKCTNLANRCSFALNIDCQGPQTVCTSKYNQLPSGGMGLTLDLDGIGDDAFCGPYGKCLGTIHIKADIHTGQHQLAQVPPPVVNAPAPAPVAAGSPFGAAPATAAAAGLWIECGLPKGPNANIDDQTKWTICRSQVAGDKAGCDLPMLPTLQSEEGRKAYCVLTEGSEGNPPKRLTEPAWLLVSNIHGKPTYESTTPDVFQAPWMRWFSNPWRSHSKRSQWMGHAVFLAVASVLSHTI